MITNIRLEKEKQGKDLKTCLYQQLKKKSLEIEMLTDINNI